MKTIRAYLLNSSLLLLSVVSAAHAQIDPTNPPQGITISRIFARLTEILNLIIPFLVLVATVVFIGGIVKYITAGADEQKTQQARMLIMWGIIALAAMLTVWGFVYVLVSALFGTTDLPGIPSPDLKPFL